MATRFGLVFLLVAVTMVMVAHSSPLIFNDQSAVIRLSNNGGDGGLVGDNIDPEEEMMLDSESSRRSLAGARYVSYSALKKNQVPCNRRGNSYYNCQERGPANPYRRGCSIITRCARRI